MVSIFFLKKIVADDEIISNVCRYSWEDVLYACCILQCPDHAGRSASARGIALV